MYEDYCGCVIGIEYLCRPHADLDLILCQLSRRIGVILPSSLTRVTAVNTQHVIQMLHAYCCYCWYSLFQC